VTASTPEYDSSFVGVPLRNVGEVPTPALSSANNYEPSANVLEGCVLSVEGCMDSTALNYDSFANINSNTWCIPIMSGCMMPSTIVGDARIQQETKMHGRDGLAANYDVSATVDSGCIVERYGCMDSTAINYEWNANREGPCWPTTVGCMHPGALNFGCPFDYDRTTGEQIITPCTDAMNNVTQISSHDEFLCTWVVRALPSDSGDGRKSVEAEILVGQDVSTILAEKKDVATLNTLKGLISGAKDDGSEVTVTAGSSNIAVSIEVNSIADMNAGVSALQTALASKELASSLLGLNVLTVPLVYGQVKAPDSDDTAIIVGASVGGAFGFMLLLGVAYFMMKRKQSKVEA